MNTCKRRLAKHLTNSGPVKVHIKGFDQARQEHPDQLEVGASDAPGTVHQHNDICYSFSLTHELRFRYKERDGTSSDTHLKQFYHQSNPIKHKPEVLLVHVHSCLWFIDAHMLTCCLVTKCCIDSNSVQHLIIKPWRSSRRTITAAG